MSNVVVTSENVAFFESYPLPRGSKVKWKGTWEEFKKYEMERDVALHEHVGHAFFTERRV